MVQVWGQSRRNRIGFRCRTQHHWVEGFVETLSRRLVDYLNSDAAREVVTAEEASVLTDGGNQSTKLAIGSTSISTATVLFAIPVEDTPRRPDIAVRSTRAIERAIVGVGPYQIMGDVFMLRENRKKGVLAATDHRFIVLADAVITHAADPGFLEHHDAVCVNRQHVEFSGAVTPRE